MEAEKIIWNRMGLIAELAKRVQPSRFGRTALMKLLYLLQTVRNVRLGYDFRLYTHGPFDQNVLEDLEFAKGLDVVKVNINEYSYQSGFRGYGYRISKGKRSSVAEQNAKLFLKQHMPDIEWVVYEFGEKKAGELELIGTIVFVSREVESRKKSRSADELAKIVREIKPHFDIHTIKTAIHSLHEKGLISGL